MIQMTKYLCPGSNEYWAIRREAFALISLIGRNLSALAVEEEGPYWIALLSARSNDTVHEILRAQGREALLTPALGPIPDSPSKTDEELIAEYFSWEPSDDPIVLRERAWEKQSYLDHINDPDEFSPRIERIMTADGIVRIETESWDDEESTFYRRETYLNGKLHDYLGEPAVRENSNHRILSEGHLDEDFEISYRHGEEVNHISHDDRVVAGWCTAQREAFGAADYEEVAA